MFPEFVAAADALVDPVAARLPVVAYEDKSGVVPLTVIRLLPVLRSTLTVPAPEICKVSSLLILVLVEESPLIFQKS